MSVHEPEHVSRDHVRELVIAADYGIIQVVAVEPIPSIGEVDPEDRAYRAEADVFAFGQRPDDDRLVGGPW